MATVSCFVVLKRTLSSFGVECRSHRCDRRARRRSFKPHPEQTGSSKPMRTSSRSKDRECCSSIVIQPFRFDRHQMFRMNDCRIGEEGRGQDHGVYADRHSPHCVRSRFRGNRSMMTCSTVRDPVRDSSENATHIARFPKRVVVKSKLAQSPAGTIRGDPSIVACAAFGDAS